MFKNLLRSWRSVQFRTSELTLYALPVAVHGLVPLLTLPFTTLILTPEDYGVLGLVNVYVHGFSLVASLGSGFQLATVRMDTPRAHSVIKTVSLLAVTLSCVFAVGSYLFWWVARQHYALPNTVSRTDIVVALIAMVLSTLWLVARPLTVLQQRPRVFSIVSTTRILVSAGAVLTALFVFEQGRFSLFLGLLALGLVDFIGAIWVLKPSMAAAIDSSLVMETIRKGATITGSSVSNMLFPILERSMLAGSAGAGVLGLYVHAQSYQRFLTDLTDPLRQSFWPRILAACRGDTTFAPFAGLISLMYAVVGFSGLLFAILGRTFINLLTNGRFGEAAPYASIMIAILLLILLARPQYATLSANGDARAVTLSTWISSGAAVAMMLVAVPLWGVFGLLGVVAVRYLILAWCFHLFARRYRKTPFMDGPPLVGAASILCVTIAMHFWSDNPGIIALVLIAAALLLVLSLVLMNLGVEKFDNKKQDASAFAIEQSLQSRQA